MKYCCKDCGGEVIRERDLYGNPYFYDPLWLHLKNHKEKYEAMMTFDNPYDITDLYTDKTVRVRDYMEKNEDIKVRLDAKESLDDCDPLFNPFWQGMLKDIPEEYQDLEVLSEGWMIEAQVNSLSVYAPDLMKVHLEEPEPEFRRGRGR